MRYFLIDKVTDIELGKSVEGIKNVTLSDEILHDHFPDFPIMPGALILEASSQLAGFLIEMTFNSAAPEKAPRRAVLAQIDKAKFYEICGPGDQLMIRATLESELESAARVKIVVKVKEKRVVRGELTFVMREIDSERVHEQRRYLYKLWTKDLDMSATIR